MSLNLKMPCKHDRHEFHYWPHIMSGFDRPVGEPCPRPEGECDPHHRYCRQTRVLTDTEALELLMEAHPSLHLDVDPWEVFGSGAAPDGTECLEVKRPDLLLDAFVAAVAADEEEVCWRCRGTEVVSCRTHPCEHGGHPCECVAADEEGDDG